MQSYREEGTLAGIKKEEIRKGEGLFFVF